MDAYQVPSIEMDVKTSKDIWMLPIIGNPNTCPCKPLMYIEKSYRVVPTHNVHWKSHWVIQTHAPMIYTERAIE